MESASTVDLINNYAKENHNGVLRCEIHEFKGRVLYATGNSQAGETLLREPPLHSVRADPNNPLYKELEALCKESNFHLEPIWYWCALNSLILDTQPPVSGLLSITQRQSELLRVLHVPSEITPCTEVKKIIRAFRLENRTTPEDLELLLQIWIHNCFEQFEDPVGYVIYFMPSFSSHSCLPNALWFTDEDHTFVLRSRADIAAGDEVTLTYLSEDDLMRPTLQRRKVLSETKDFICTCERCSAPVDFSRGFRCPACGIGSIYVEPDAELTLEEIEEVFSSAGNQTIEAFLPWDLQRMSSLPTKRSSASSVSSPEAGGSVAFSASSDHVSESMAVDDCQNREDASASLSRPKSLSLSLLAPSSPAAEALIPLTVWMCLLVPGLAGARLAGGRRASACADACITPVGPELSLELSDAGDSPCRDRQRKQAPPLGTQIRNGSERSPEGLSPPERCRAVLTRVHRSVASLPTVTRMQQISPNSCVLCKKEWTHSDRMKGLALEALLGRWANPQEEAGAVEGAEDPEPKHEEALDATKAEEANDDQELVGENGKGRACKADERGRRASRGVRCSGAEEEQNDREGGDTRRDEPSENGRSGQGVPEEDKQEGDTNEAEADPTPKASRRKGKTKLEFEGVDGTDSSVQSQHRRWLMKKRVSSLKRLLKKSWRRHLSEDQRHSLNVLLPEIFQFHWHLVCWLKAQAAVSTGAEKVTMQDAIVYQQRNLYPGLNAALGWSLDEMAEILLLAYQDQPDKPIKMSPTSMKALIQDRSILAAYDEAVSILGTLFETNHQFVTDVTKKLSILSDWIRGSGLEMDPLASPWLNAGHRFFQRSYSGRTTPGLLCMSGSAPSWAIVERSFQLPKL
ncbi:putative histone lysine methyltransferase, SET [Toxoplasma gondii RUB]|uniref:Putative histone lysine methyltransferase, SET n=1 Tax=Toxoplasma gondii RUB TaxID=935652 RepID=A0A086M0X7_TOXGO|nr:putative histone lysine methyltransferase, SET [Toxoplasma gondii RUB]